MSTTTPLPELPSKSLPRDLLKNRDYTLILGRTCVSHQVPHLAESWLQAQDAIQALIATCTELDADGITLYLASEQASATSGFQKYEQVVDGRLPQLLSDSYPPSSFDFVQVLDEAIADYFHRKAAGKTQANGEIFLVILDGEPTSRKRLAKLVVETTARMAHKNELAIGLVQIGDDSMAQGLFQYLDDELYTAGATHDMVHTQKITTLNLEKLSVFLWDVLTD